MSTSESSPRDFTRSIDHYRRVIADIDAAIRSDEEAGMVGGLPIRCLAMACATYSAGDPVAVPKRWLDRAVTHQLKYLKERNYQFSGYGRLQQDLEVFGAAAIAGRVGELAEATQRIECNPAPVPRVRGLLDQLGTMWDGADFNQDAKEMSDVKKNPDWAALPALFRAVADRDISGAAAPLAAYLSKSWAKGVKTVERMPNYSGPFSFLAGGVCQHLGGVPELPEAALRYVPVDLVETGSRAKKRKG